MIRPFDLCLPSTSIKHIFLLGIFLVLSSVGKGQYLIEGHIEKPDTNLRAYLNILNQWNEFNTISEYMILKGTRISADGYFRFEGNELSDAQGFYKIHFADPTFTVVHMTGDPEQKNFFHFLLTNQDTVSIQLKDAIHAPGELEIQSTIPQNQILPELQANFDRIQAQDKKSQQPNHLRLIENKLSQSALENWEVYDHTLIRMYLLHNGNLEAEKHQEKFMKTLMGLRDPNFRPVYFQSLQEHMGSKLYGELKKENAFLRQINYGLWGLVCVLALGIFFLFRINKRKSTESPVPSVIEGLTSKEKEVAKLIGERLTNKEIAARLFISEATVKTHLNSIYRKTKLPSRAQLQQQLEKETAI
ncbi:MAG: helix-turn-helix transcriptional regulator [Bacteroidota bacterium]